MWLTSRVIQSSTATQPCICMRRLTEGARGACNSPLQVYEKAGTGPKDEDRFKLARDTQNPVAFDKRRNLGTYRTTTNMAYQAPQDVSTVHCLCLM